MIDGMTLKEYMQNEKSKWKDMSSAQKWDYFKTYYLKSIIIVAIIIAVLVYILLQIFVFRKDDVMSGLVVNHELSDEAIESFEEGYAKLADINTSRESVSIRASNVSDQDYNSIMVVETNTGAGTLDFMIVDKSSYELLNAKSIYSNLEDVLDKDALAKVDGLVIDTTDVDTNQTYPAAIDISGTEYARKYLDGRDAYLVFIVSGEHLSDASKVVEYFFN